MWSGLMLAAAVFSTLPVIRAADKVCYGQTGNEDPTLGVCDPDAEVSSCCKLGDYCLSNGLCNHPGVTSANATYYTVYYIAGCTSDTADTGGCSVYQQCIKQGVGVTSCLNNEYCCYGLGGCSCTNASAVFSLDAGTIITSLPASLPTSSTASSSSTSFSASSSTTSSSTTSSSATSSYSASGTSSSTSSSASSSAAPAKLNDSTAIGAGVGVGVGVPVLAAIAFGFWFWRRRQSRASAANAAPSQFAHDGSQAYTADPKYAAPATGYAPVPAHDGYYNQAVPSEMYGSQVPHPPGKAPTRDGRSELSG